jgi:hypothetical protein
MMNVSGRTPEDWYNEIRCLAEGWMTREETCDGWLNLWCRASGSAPM